jgi:hypothetical protein
MKFNGNGTIEGLLLGGLGDSGAVDSGSIDDTLEIHLKSGRKNLIINGNLDIWQRGKYQIDNEYGSADRWGHNAIGTGQSISQLPFSSGQTEVPNNPKYYSESVITSVLDPGNLAIMFQRIEDVNILSGETVTVSFWARTTTDPKNMAVNIDQYFGTGSNSPADNNRIDGELVALTTDWAKYSVTYILPSTDGKTSGDDGNSSTQLNFWFDADIDLNNPSGGLGQQSGTFHIAQVQMEIGSIATDFEHRSYKEELALCQRYYYRIDGNDNQWISPAQVHGIDGGLRTVIDLPVALRSWPTIYHDNIGYWYGTSFLNMLDTFSLHYQNPQTENISPPVGVNPGSWGPLGSPRPWPDNTTHINLHCLKNGTAINTTGPHMFCIGNDALYNPSTQRSVGFLALDAEL